jgi:soluble lytic murein transglycosylase
MEFIRRFYICAILSILVWLTAACGQIEEAPTAVDTPVSLAAATPTLAAAFTRPPTPVITPWLDDPVELTAVPPDIDAPTPEPTASPTPTVTSSPTATPTPVLTSAERLELAYRALHNEDYGPAIDHFQALLAAAEAANEARANLLLGLSRAYLGDGRYPLAIESFSQYLALTPDRSSPLVSEQPAADPVALFLLAQAYQRSGDCEAAVPLYQEHIIRQPLTAPYAARPLIQCQLASGDLVGAITSYETAMAQPAHRITEVENRLQLAQHYLDDGRYDEAIAQYEAIINVAQTENTRGQANYRIGSNLLLAGDEEAAFQRYQTGIRLYPRAYESYLGLVALVQAEQPVDEFQRGLVNYHARNFLPAIAAFDRYLAANQDEYRLDTHLFLAWSYAGAGNTTAAFTQLEAYLAAGPDDPVVQAQGLLERARLHGRLAQRSQATTAYLAFVEAFPVHNEAPDALWLAAQNREWDGDRAGAAALFQRLAEDYPTSGNSARALFRAGWLLYREDDVETAVTLWQQTVAQYAAQEYGAAAAIWLLRTDPDNAPPTARRAGISYYDLRWQDLQAGLPVFYEPERIDLDFDEAREQAQAETWLRLRLDLPEGTAVGGLAPALQDDARRQLGEALWRMGLLEEAKRELEAVRAEHSENGWFSYQLAVYFRDLGLYRSSIIAASSVLRLTGATPFTAPRFVARLAYPVYYADLILPLAGQYGYDPLLQFALVRQESLFESFARSHAAAQGLSQVIPDTGRYIAMRLAWPNYENELLYRPAVGLVFGAYYLQEQLNNFDGDVYAALSAYNAGPGNAARWRNQAPDDPDLYVEIVNFPETRLYIERIYAGHAIYRFLYGE